MRVLIACEFSGTVRDAFAKRGHDAWSCDLLPTETPGNHIQGDVLDILDDGWDVMIAHPPCTYLCVSGAMWMYHPLHKDRRDKQQDAIDFFLKLYNAPIDRIGIENPIGIMSTVFQKPSQIIHPYYFGETESKSTCLWLKNLPKLNPTEMVIPTMIDLPDGRKMSKYHYDSWHMKKQERWKIRSKTFQGIADSMADQWGDESKLGKIWNISMQPIFA